MDLEKISKFISLVLRHKPEAAGITLDSHGWANVDDLVIGINKNVTACFGIDDLETIVKTDKKGRYSFNSDKTAIRANQGHSIPVDLELEEVEPQELLYHGTSVKYVESIRQQGILPKSRLQVHLSADMDTALIVGARHGRPVIIVVDAGKMYKDGYKFYLSENGVWLTDIVPCQYLKVLLKEKHK